MEKDEQLKAILYAFLAAVFYAVGTPVSKLLLEHIEPVVMAGLLYIGAGIGVGVMYLFNRKKEGPALRLSRSDLPYTVGMILLDIAAPILLMLGISIGSASNASLLGNFEIVATTMIAFLFFKELVSKRLWAAVGIITLASIVLSFEGNGSLQFSAGSILVILATCCWGLENNCTRSIADKSTYEIVILKGIFSGGGALIIGLLLGQGIPAMKFLAAALLLGFVSYGLSIFLYVRAQRDLGASRTSAYYAVAPFIGAFLAFAVNGDQLTASFFAGLLIMMAGTALVVYDTLHRDNGTHGRDGASVDRDVP